MLSRLTIAVLSAAGCALAAMPAAARPYLMLSADDHGFQALDLSNVKRTPESPDPLDKGIIRRRPSPAELQPRPADGAAQKARDAIGAREDQKFVQDQTRAGRLPDNRIAPDPAAGDRPRQSAAQAQAAAIFTPDTVEVTVIDAPLAGAAYGDKLAPMIERRVEVSCGQPRWRTLSTTFADAHEAVLAKGEASAQWAPFGDDAIGPTVQAAACQRQFRQAAVSRYLNIGEILANYQAAHSQAPPQPQTREQLLAQRFKNSH